MAKRIKELRLDVFVDPVGGNYILRKCYYQVDDDTLADVVYAVLTGPNPVPSRGITAGELTGTLQAFLDTVKSDVETQEGI